ncbi:MAG: hypothetical protein JSV04_00770 [Candidatus Heimdallarchaeota archaeon]|nr:MAG: hypothetical protein JSV04_00770 [Candidatus Heimdallarchaeota archaeon]
MNSDNEESQPQHQLLKDYSLWNLGLATAIASLSSFLIVLAFTTALSFISRELWTEMIIWPPALFIGGGVGGGIGGILASWEIRTAINEKSKITPFQLFPPDLFYLSILVLLTYVLEMLSESLILQILLFVLEIALFIVIGRNISKLTLNVSETIEISDIKETNSEE